MLYYGGLNASTLFSSENDITIAVDQFSKIMFPDVTNIEIGWNYFLLWRNNKLYITGKINDNSMKDESVEKLVEIPERLSERYKSVVAGTNSIVILLANNEIFLYKFYENLWHKVPNFISNNDNLQIEYITKILQTKCTVVLTNLGRVFSIPTLIEIPKRVKIIDIACGFDHTLLLSENGDVYSMGMGTRGQLGHNDLEDCDNPKLIEALAGIKVTQISASGWHNAVITEQGDLYSWGWNTDGELGISDESTKVVAVPTLIDFKDKEGAKVEYNVRKVQCGNVFTICMMDDGTLWGSGSNKYGQLGQLRQNFTSSQIFVKLDIPVEIKNIKDVKCREWGTVIVTD